jgi:CheY-like chemotaxis protein/HPt (histidine-containing phosphotransfer) domain-containing protein
LTGVHVLLAEDNPVNQDVAVEMLQDMGCEVDTVVNGLEVLPALERMAYDAILMDCHMPLMDGYRATEEIRRREGDSGRHVPIIALTANVMKGDPERCLQAGMDGYLGKPFKMDQLAEVLERHLTGRGLASGVPAPAAGVRPMADPASDPAHEADVAAGSDGPGGSGIPGGSGMAAGSGGAGGWDEDRMQGLRALQRPGRPDALNKIIGIYLDCTPDLLQSLSDGIEENDPEKIQMAAHSLKGCSGNLGAIRLTGLFAKLEAMGRDKDTALAPEVFRQATAEYEVVRRELEGIRERKAA